MTTHSDSQPDALWNREAVASNSSSRLAQNDPPLTNVEAQVDASLKSMGIAQPSALRDEHGWWSIQYGSTRARIGVLQVEDTPYLRVTAHVLDVPAQSEMQLALYRELLDFNVGLPGAARVGTAGGAVFVTATVPADILHDDEVSSIIGHTLSTADELMQPLQQRYANSATGEPRAG